MSQPVVFQSATSRFGLPLLYSGQAQKEFFVNEAHAMIDALVHTAVEGQAASPPAAPQDGESWMVANGAQAEWLGQDGDMALYQAGSWKFISPMTGTTIFDKQSGQNLLFDVGWQSATEPAAISGGAVVDAEARAALSSLIEALRNLGVFQRI